MKKFLSLVLALVMTMSLVTISAGAKDFDDNGDIDYKEAVDVISALGIVDGYSDGSFRPDGSLTRGAAAKIICNLILGPTTASALSASTAPFKDVPTTNTFAGYITYCAQQGIISGYGDGTFRPTGTLTGNAFMKMLLGALGYDSTIEGYTGSNWTVNVIKQAVGIGLDDGNDDFVGSRTVTRQEAALYAFNMINATMVEYENQSTITVGGVEIVTSSARKDVANTTSTDGNIDGEPNGDDLMQFGERYFTSLKANPDQDAFSRPATTWRYNNRLVGTYTDEADLTYTSSVELQDVYADLGLTEATKATEQYVDGKEADKNDIQTLARRDDTDVIGSANGVLTQVWYDEDDRGNVDYLIISAINTYVAEVSRVNNDGDDDRSITLAPKGNSNPAGNLDRQFETQDFDRNDLVVYTAAYDGSRYEIQSVDALELTTTAVITAWEGDSTIDPTVDGKGTSEANFTAGGTTYKYSAKKVIADEDGAVLSGGIADFEVDESEINIYLDQYGYAIYVSGVEAEKNYAAVIGIGSSNTHGSETKGVTLLLPDGTQKEVTADMDNWSDLSSLTNLVSDGRADLVTYTVDDDNVYQLEVVASAALGSTAEFSTGRYQTITGNTNTTFENGKSLMEIYTRFADPTPDTYSTAAKGTYYTTSETIFMVATPKSGGGYNYNVYVGYQNAPGIDVGTDVNGMAFVMNSYYKNQIDVVYIDADKMAGISGVDTFFVKDGSKILTNNDGRYYVFPAIVDEQETTIKIDPSIKLDMNGDGDTLDVGDITLEAAAKGVYAIDNITMNSKGIITGCDLQNTNYFTATNGGGTDYDVGTIAANEVVLGIGTNRNTATYWAYNDDTMVYLVDKDYKTITVSDIDAIYTDDNDLVYAAYNREQKVLTDVIVVEQPNTVTETYDIGASNGVKFWNSGWVASLSGVSAGTTVYVSADDPTMKPVINGVALTLDHYESDGRADYTFTMPKYDIAAGAFTTVSAGYGMSSIKLSAGAGNGEVKVDFTPNAALADAISKATASPDVTYDYVLLSAATGTDTWLVADDTKVNQTTDNTVTFTGLSQGTAGYMVRITVKIGTSEVGTFTSDGYSINVKGA